MSLFFHRRGIESSLAGRLSATAEDHLRQHLRRCASCRNHYDQLSLLKAASSAAADLTITRERNRIINAIAPQTRPTTARPQALRRFVPLVLVPILGLSAFFLFFRPRVGNQSDAEISWRGAIDADAGASGDFSLLLFASPRLPSGKPGLVRLVADFPHAGEATVGRDNHLQFAYRDLRVAAQIVIVGTHSGGETRLLYGPASDSERFLPSLQTRLLGPRLPPGSLTAGIWRIQTLVITTPIAAETLRELAKNPHAISRLNGHSIQSVLTVLP